MDPLFCRIFPNGSETERAARQFFSKGCPEVQMPDELKRNWNDVQKQSCAEALLWNKFHYDKNSSGLWMALMTYSPFGENMPSLEHLQKANGCVAVFPICSDSVSKLCFMYLFKSEGLENFADHRNFLSEKFKIPENVRVFMTVNFKPLDCPIDGDSWQLAFAMASKALEKSVPEKRALAGFLLTGAVNAQNEVKGVSGITVKAKLLSDIRNWQFLFPEENQNDIPGTLSPARYQFVSSTDQAWRLISKTGFETGDIRLPEKITELHVLVGASINPVLYSVFLLAPEKVCLWHSGETLKEAQDVSEYLEQLCPGIFAVELKQMDSGSLQACYSELDDFFRDSSDIEGCVLNITGGNRLMGYAALLIAQTYIIKAVYRDFNAGKELLAAISFDDGKRRSETIRINRCPEEIKKNIPWEELLKKDNVR